MEKWGLFFSDKLGNKCRVHEGWYTSELAARKAALAMNYEEDRLERWMPDITLIKGTYFAKKLL